MFYVDKDTMADLNLFGGTSGEGCIFNLFNHATTYGGRFCLKEMFEHPLSCAQQIQERIDLIQYLESSPLALELDKQSYDFIEHYLNIATIPTRKSFINTLRRRIKLLYREDNEYYIIKRGIGFLIEALTSWDNLTRTHATRSCVLLQKFCGRMAEIFEGKALFAQISSRKTGHLSIQEIATYDNFFRYTAKDNIRELLFMVYQIDAFRSVAQTKAKYDFALPEIVTQATLEIRSLYHPLLKNPVDNDLALDTGQNICFITGANMSGKSTFMKAFGVAVYLAHIGFPVPAKAMRFSAFDGLISSINLADHLALGYSHFYSEVKRIKNIATIMAHPANLIVIFDELFRGTNLKDAQDGSIQIIRAFAKKHNSFFLFSTHITEVAEALQTLKNIKFACFKTQLIDDSLQYAYKLVPGISQDRLGMYIIDKENLIDLIERSE